MGIFTAEEAHVIPTTPGRKETDACTKWALARLRSMGVGYSDFGHRRRGDHRVHDLAGGAALPK